MQAVRHVKQRNRERGREGGKEAGREEEGGEREGEGNHVIVSKRRDLSIAITIFNATVISLHKNKITLELAR